MNSISGLTAQVIQDALYDDVILHICRAADPARQRDKTNNTFRRLLELTDGCSGRATFETACVEFQEACKPLQQRRNTSIAHADRKAHFESEGTGGVSRQQIETAIDKWRELTFYIGSAAFDAHLICEVATERKRDEVAFLRALYHGRDALAKKEEQAMHMVLEHADTRQLPPEVQMLREIQEKPDWLNCRPPERND
ncbi:MAG: hypothetical protein DI498_14035 [Paracoccus denitrificans]|nr:MAG: hypothetical protein DI498_14035 [Paracoccus denitrificans]PZO82816.1 MAG: hypothetical protein DI633_14035 [Paracoccus denitrificans]